MSVVPEDDFGATEHATSLNNSPPITQHTVGHTCQQQETHVYNVACAYFISALCLNSSTAQYSFPPQLLHKPEAEGKQSEYMWLLRAVLTKITEFYVFI